MNEIVEEAPVHSVTQPFVLEVGDPEDDKLGVIGPSDYMK